MVKTHLNKQQKDLIFICLMLAIPIIHFLVFWLYVNIGSIAMAFQDRLTGEFTLANFKQFFRLLEKDTQMGGTLKYAFGNTVTHIAISSFIVTPLNVFVSFILFKKFFGHTFFRVVFYVPTIIGGVVMSMMTVYVLDATGPIIALTKAMGIKWDFEILQTGLLGNLKSANATIFINSLNIAGSTILLLTGALGRIPRDIFDSGKIDGMGMFREFLYIAVPLTWSTTGIMWVMGFANGWASDFGVYLLTGGGYGTTTFGSYLFANTLTAATTANGDFHYPAAMGLMLSAVVIPLTLLVRHFSDKIVEQVEF